jgi:hypothetical protein
MNRIGLSIEGADAAMEWLQKIAGIVKPRLRDMGIAILREAQRISVGRVSSQYHYGATPSDQRFLQVRTGNLRRYLLAEPIVEVNDSLEWGVTGDDKEARIGTFLYTGGTILPKVGQYLRIPTKFALTAKGVDRNDGAKMRDVPGFAVFKSRAGNLFIWKLFGKKKPPEPWYLLKTSVTVREHKWFPSPEEDLGGFVEWTGQTFLRTIGETT